jgi:hypothetical protein
MISGWRGTIRDTKSYELFYEEREERDDSGLRGKGLDDQQDRVRPERRGRQRQRERRGMAKKSFNAH